MGKDPMDIICVDCPKRSKEECNNGKFKSYCGRYTKASHGMYATKQQVRKMIQNEPNPVTLREYPSGNARDIEFAKARDTDTHAMVEVFRKSLMEECE